MGNYVISDTHFGHANILKFERTEFTTIDEHDEYIIKKWNERIHKTDTVYHLGDVGIKNKEYLINIISRLNGKKILILGNHDRNAASIKFYLEVGFDEVYNKPIYYNSKIILSHEPIQEAYNNPFILNIHGHLHNSYLNLENFYNVSAALIRYIPQNLERFEKKTFNLKKRDESFLEEWYAKHYIFTDKENRTDIVCENNGLIKLEDSFKSVINSWKDETSPLELDNQIVFIKNDKLIKATIVQFGKNCLVAKKRGVAYHFELDKRNIEFYKCKKSSK